jgi:hypothetical protein
MTARSRLFCAAAIAIAGAGALSGCKTKGEIVVQEGVGITAVRGACPAVGIPDYTGDVTLFTTPGSRDAAAIDVTASITNLRSQCDDGTKNPAAKVYSGVGFDVLARRTDVRGARQVTLPYFVTVLRGGRAVVTKRVGTVVLNFADGQARAQARGEGGAFIDRAEATLPADVRERITRKRKAGDQDAAIDPLTQPEVRAAVQRATFEVLVGFQLDENQLNYNVRR